MKKILILFLIIISMTSAVYGLDNDYIKIISPDTENNGQIISKEDLFISVYAETDEKLLLSLIKKENKILKTDEDLPIYTTENNDVEKVSLDEVDIKPVESLTKNEIISKYKIAREDYEILRLDYVKALNLYDKEEEYFIMLETMYLNAREEYIKSKKEFEALFQKEILKDVEIYVDPAFPYFEYTIEGIEAGSYEIIIANTEGKVVERLSFDVITDTMIVDKIKNEFNLFKSFINDEVFE